MINKELVSARKYILLPTSPSLLKTLEEVTDPELLNTCKKAWDKISSDEIRVWLAIESRIIELAHKFYQLDKTIPDLYNSFYEWTHTGSYYIDLDSLELKQTPEFLRNDFKKKMVFQWSSKDIGSYLEVKSSLINNQKFIPEEILLNISHCPLFKFTDFSNSIEPTSITYVIRSLWNSYVNKKLYKGCNFIELDPTSLEPLLNSKSVMLYNKDIIQKLKGKQLLLSQVIYNYILDGQTPEWPIQNWIDLFHMSEKDVKWSHFKRDNISRYLPKIGENFALDLKVIETKQKRSVVSAYIQIEEKENVDKPYKLVELIPSDKELVNHGAEIIEAEGINQKNTSSCTNKLDENLEYRKSKSQDTSSDRVIFTEDLLSPTIKSNLLNKYSEHFLEYKLAQFSEANASKKHTRDMWIRKLKAYLQKGWKWWTTVNEDEWTSERLKESVFEQLAQNPHYDEEYDRSLADCLIDDFVRSRGLTTEVSRVLSYVCGSLEVFRAKKSNQLKLSQAYADNTDKHVDELKQKNRSTTEELNDFGWATFKFESGTGDA